MAIINPANAINPRKITPTTQEATATEPDFETRRRLATKGAENERERIMAVYERSAPGNEKEIKAMMADGKTTGTEAGDRIFMAGKPKREAGYKKMQEKINKPDNFTALCENYQKENKCSKGKAISAIALLHPSEHTKYVKNLRNLTFLKKTWNGNQSLHAKYENDFEKFHMEKANVTPSPTRGKDFKALMDKYQAEHNCSIQDAGKACAKLYPEIYLGI